MRALIYDPYLDTLGGGERYCLTVAECLLKNNWQVDLFWKQKKDLEKAIKRFNLAIESANLIGKKPEELSFWQRIKLQRRYDLIFWLSDGSLPLLLGKQNILHFQIPFTQNILFQQLLYQFINKLKQRLVDLVVCNSYFTKKYIDRTYGVNSVVLYPPVDVEKFPPKRKENIILAVGRFEETMQAKRQDVLIQTFIKMINQGLRDWRLVLIGGSLQSPEKNQYLRELKQMAEDYPIEFLVNASFEVLKDYYQRAKIFWHAAGFGVDEEKEPHRVEHFGITTVEAMAAGCVPVVIDKGGLREIVRRGVGKRWQTKTELIKFTWDLIQNSDQWDNYHHQAQERAKMFSKKNFCQQLNRLVSS